jgi:hypothetical protein
MIEGDYSRARSYYEECRTVTLELGERRVLAVARGLLGTLARYEGDLDSAQGLYGKSLQDAQELGGHIRVQDWLIGLGCVAVMRGELAGTNREAAEHHLWHGAQLFSAADALLEATGGIIWAHDRPDYEAYLAAARTALGETPFAAAWDEGRAMSLEEAVRVALEHDASSERANEREPDISS